MHTTTTSWTADAIALGWMPPLRAQATLAHHHLYQRAAEVLAARLAALSGSTLESVLADALREAGAERGPADRQTTGAEAIDQR
jgi:hypothetical protein